MSPPEATAAGYVPVTDPFSPSQHGMIAAAVETLKRGGIVTVLVQVPNGVEVWRQKPVPVRQPSGRGYGYHALSK